MRVACPGCAAVYEPPAERLKPGLRLRCGACGETWSLPGAPGAADAVPEPPAASPAPVAEAVLPVTAPSASGPEIAPAGPVPESVPDRAGADQAQADQAKIDQSNIDQSGPARVAARRIALAPDGTPQRRERLEALIDDFPPERSPAGVIAGWLVTAAVLGGLAWGAYTYRGEVMAAWPPSTRVYAGLGLVK